MNTVFSLVSIVCGKHSCCCTIEYQNTYNKYFNMYLFDLQPLSEALTRQYGEMCDSLLGTSRTLTRFIKNSSKHIGVELAHGESQYSQNRNDRN